jgi:hypothetical protein
MRIAGMLFVAMSLVLTSLLRAEAAPDISITSSRPSIQKGTPFEIRIEIAAREPISNIVLVPLVPYGFTLVATSSPGMSVDSNTNIVRIPQIEAGSSLAIIFQGSSPRVLGLSKVSTAEAKTFAFNVFYVQEGASGKESSSQVITTTVQYTTHISIFLIAGLVGTILGHVIKTGIKRREQLAATIRIWSTTDFGEERCSRSWLGPGDCIRNRSSSINR